MSIVRPCALLLDRLSKGDEEGASRLGRVLKSTDRWMPGGTPTLTLEVNVHIGHLAKGTLVNSQQRRNAIQRIQARQNFYVHLAFSLALGTFFVATWAQSGDPNFWPIWPLLGGGLGLAAHASHVFGWERRIGEERIQREINRST